MKGLSKDISRDVVKEERDGREDVVAKGGFQVPLISGAMTKALRHSFNLETRRGSAFGALRLSA